MKTINQIFVIGMFLLLFCNVAVINAQDDEPKRPMYLSATTMYWNKDYDGNMDDWKAVEKEYLEKVTRKNEYIMTSGYYVHLFTENSNEVIYVRSYPSWEAIEKATARSAELEKEAWPDDTARGEFMDKLRSAFSSYHSDEIMATMPGAKHMEAEPTKDLVLYLRKNKWAFPEDGTMAEYSDLMEKIHSGLILKNEYIKAYYPSQHAWGSDKRDFIQAFFLDSMDDLSKMFDRNDDLSKDALSEDEWKAFSKYFKGHGDYLYKYIYDLSK